MTFHAIAAQSEKGGADWQELVSHTRLKPGEALKLREALKGSA